MQTFGGHRKGQFGGKGWERSNIEESGRMVGIILVFVLRRQNCAVTKHYLNKFETVPFKPRTGYCGFGERIGVHGG